MSALRKLVLAGGIALLASGLAASPAAARNGHGGSLHSGSPHSSGGEDGQTLTAGAGTIVFDTGRNGSGPSAGPIAAVGDWSPPPCWYEPTYTPRQFKAENEAIWAEPSVGDEWVTSQKKKYDGGKPPMNFNIGRAGYWWTGVPNPAMLADPASLACTDHGPFWVPKGKSPQVDDAVSPLVLAELAYQRIRVPDTAVSLSPRRVQTVNLDTWAWLDKATFKPVSVTARLGRLGIRATTTATPVALHLDPGTADATVYPASGDCPISGGHIGTRYTASDGNRTPPCGFTYLKATTGRGPYRLKATITWKVRWTGTGGGGDLPDGTFGTTVPLTVQEVQSVVR